MNDPFVGSLTFTRIYSGVLKKGDQMLNSTKGRRERVGRMMMMHSNNRAEIDEAFAGDIIALAGLKETTTGDTLCDPTKTVVLETMTFPEPVIEIAVEPKSKADQEKMALALQRLAAEDPSFRVETDMESGQTIMKGMGELAPRHPRRPHEARVQGRGEYRRPAGGLSRDHLAADRDRLHPQEADRRHRAVRPCEAGNLARPNRAKATPSTSRIVGGTCRRNTSPASRRASSR